MRTLHSTLLVGPCDWDPERMPQQEFVDRIESLWAHIADCAGAIVYGDSRNHAELTYLTNLVPKLRPLLALFSRHGACVLVADGTGVLPSVARMTWIEKLRPLGDARHTLEQWVAELPGRQVALIGGEYMRPALNRALAGVAATVDATPALRATMLHKRPRERAALQGACGLLTRALQALGVAQRAGANVTETVLAGERAAIHEGAQDVRTLFSVDGGRTLRPFEIPVDLAIDPLQVYVAVRHLGYWAEGFTMLASAPNPVTAHVKKVLGVLMRMAHVGTSCDELARCAIHEIAPYRPHDMTAGSGGNSIGLALEEAPLLAIGSEAALEGDGVYTLRVGASDGQGHHAIVSAMIAVGTRKTEVLWAAP